MWTRRRVATADAVAAERKRLAELATTNEFLQLGQAVASVESEAGWVSMATVIEDAGATGELSSNQAAELQSRLGSLALRRGWAGRDAVREYAGDGAVKTADSARLLSDYQRATGYRR